MTRAAVIIAVVSALLAGAAMGLMGGIFFTHHVVPHFMRMHHGGARWRHGPPGGPSPREMLPNLSRRLDLQPAQEDSIREEIERSRGDFDAVRESLHVRIERHLTPKQRERLRVLVRERHPGDFGGPMGRPHRAEPGSHERDPR